MEMELREEGRDKRELDLPALRSISRLGIKVGEDQDLGEFHSHQPRQPGNVHSLRQEKPWGLFFPCNVNASPILRVIDPGPNNKVRFDFLGQGLQQDPSA